MVHPLLATTVPTRSLGIASVSERLEQAVHHALVVAAAIHIRSRALATDIGNLQTVPLGRNLFLTLLGRKLGLFALGITFSLLAIVISCFLLDS